jgi:RNase H-like domain found in reverse transcriptase
MGRREPPVAFISRKLNDAEKNYHKHDRELLAIVLW